MANKDNTSKTLLIIVIVLLLTCCIGFPLHSDMIERENFVISKYGNTKFSDGDLNITVPDDVAKEGAEAVKTFVLQHLDAAIQQGTSRIEVQTTTSKEGMDSSTAPNAFSPGRAVR